MAKTLSEREVLQLARLGAMARLEELEEEARAIRRMFPGLKTVGARADGAETERTAAPKAGRKGRGRKARTMTEEQRQAQRERMLAYWAKRKGQTPDSEAGQAGVDAANEQAPSKRARKPRRKARGRKAATKG